MTADVRRARTAFLWVGLIVPLAMLAATAVIVALWLPDIPEPAAIHWSEDGVDGYGPGWTWLLVIAGIAVLVAALALLARFAHRLPEKGRPRPAEGDPVPEWSATARFLGATNLGVAAMMALIALVGVGSQRGLTDASQTPDIGYAVLGGFLLLALGALVGWLLQPATPLPALEPSAEAVPLAASATERVGWVGTASLARVGLWVIGVAVLLVCVLAVVFLATGAGGPWTAVILLGTCLLLAAAFVTTFAFRVRVGPAGLQVRSLAGWPRFVIPVDDVAAVRAVAVNPFAEFGGWGVRWGLDGRFGVVLRRGEAVEVTRTDGRRFVVTVDGADEAAAALATAARKAG